MKDGRQKVRKKWTRPEVGVAKLNVDGAFVEDGGAGAGIILRDHRGEVIVSACRHLLHCKDATEAEMDAIEEGLKLSLTWTPLKIVVESDCADAVKLIQKETPNTSIHAFRVSVIRELLQEREIKIASISRDANGASHELAKMGRVQRRTEVWLQSFPQEISTSLEADDTTPRA